MAWHTNLLSWPPRFALMAALLCAAGAAAAAPQTGTPEALPPGALMVGSLAPTETISFELNLPLRQQAELEQTLQSLYDPRNPAFHHFLTPGQFTAAFGPTQSDYDAVAAAAQAQGLTVTQRQPGRTLLGVSGPVSVVQKMFGTTLLRYQLADGRAFHAPQAEPSLPASLAGKVAGVIGLNDAPEEPASDQASAAASPQATSNFGGGPAGGLTPAQVKLAYNLNNVTLTGTGQTLALFELADYADSDIAGFEQQYGLPAATLQRIYLDGQPGSVNTSTNTGEVTEDIEVALGLAPGVKVLVYETITTEQGNLDGYARIASDDLANEISTSWYYFGRSAAGKNAENQAFVQMAAQGQSMFALTGDNGAYNPSGTKVTVADPGEQPYVTSVGGTTLSLNSDGTYASESAWADPSNTSRGPTGVGGGGGLSVYWPLPFYQQAVVSHAPSGQFSSTQRNLPDVSLDADLRTPYSLYIKGRWLTSAGTSAATPLWASFAALVNQQRATAGRPLLGFADPAIYALAENPASYARDFHDIADGSTNLYYETVPGYDVATGWGSFNGANLLDDLASATGGVPSHTPLLWNNVNGQAAFWFVNSDGSYASTLYGPFPSYTARAVAEAPNGSTYLLWTSTNGTASLWNITGSGYTHHEYGPFTGYSAVSLSVGGDGSPHLLWDKTDGTALLWTVNAGTGAFTYTAYGPFAGYTAKLVASGETVTDLLWTKTDGTADGWRINNTDGTYVNHTFGPFSGYTAVGLSVGPDDQAHLLWDKTDGTAALWNADFTTGEFTHANYGPFSGYTAKAIATGPDNATHLLWDNVNGQVSLWNVAGSGYTHHEYGPFSGWTAVAVSAGP